MRRVAAAISLAAVLVSQQAAAGGFDLPDIGAQAMGRGAAFVSKADDGTAIYWNPAGLARQRGTNALINGNLYLHSFQFKRIGTYPDDPQDGATPWGNAPYPVVSNTAGPYFAPFAAATTDFGYFDRLTFGIGVFSPPTIANRTFPLEIEGKPAPSRYDYVQSLSSMLYPTASLGLRVTPWLDLGVSAHLVLASFRRTALSYVEDSKEACQQNEKDGVAKKEDFRCDSRNELQANGTSFAATIGAMIRPVPEVQFGASFRTPTNITANGQFTPEQPDALQGKELAPGNATLAMQLPWMLRVGGRYIGMDADFELYDLELNVTYEAWGSAQAVGPILTIPDIGAFQDIQSVIQHGYADTFGVRAGGAYNIDTGEGILALRGGAYFDSSATDARYTRLDYDTLAKVAGTLGVGYRVGGFSFDLAYAAVASLPRTVGTGAGDLRPINDAQDGDVVGVDGQPLSVINEGAYKGFTHILSAGITVSIEGLFGGPRPVHYGNAYEPNYVGDGETKKPENDEEKPPPSAKKPEEKKPPKPEEEKPPKVEEEQPPKPEEKKPPKPEEKKPPKPPPEEPELHLPPSTPFKPPPKRKEWWEEAE